MDFMIIEDFADELRENQSHEYRNTISAVI